MALADAPGNIRIGKAESGLSKPSVVNVSQVLTIDKALLTDRVRPLSAAAMIPFIGSAATGSKFAAKAAKALAKQADKLDEVVDAGKKMAEVRKAGMLGEMAADTWLKRNHPWAPNPALQAVACT